MATASMILGIISICISLPKSLFLLPVGLISLTLAILALVFGIISLKEEGSNAKAITGVTTGGVTIFISICTLLFYIFLLAL